MKSFFLLLVLGMGFSIPARAATDCTNASTQIEMNECAAKAYKIADQRLNAVYKKVQKQFDKAGQAKLKTAQRNWISYRDAQCAVEAHRSEGGSIQSMIIMNCLERLTREQTNSLRGTSIVEGR